ncbi:phosphoglucosamine mutase [Oscillibacter sp.]|uniref:phosphoglucosamine mutase n=1 Tax=Oscillibacter sp. TaxID=1945593 RepID=UPI0026272677|nr:phosphoglucosamine mutase [Oscillibacter sp.]MDD3346437.1 phosphoglucosamine mutase [Oscillibacter sp.]
MGKLFGTDGIRGVVGENLTAEMAFRVGQAIAAVLMEEKGSRPTVVIGKDTRISSDMLESALMAGICDMGGDVKPLGTVPTPAVAYLARQEKADAGIVLSASHNPYEHNGIKVFSGQGYKLSDEVEARIEEKILSGAPLKHRTRGEIGRRHHGMRQLKQDYIDFVASTVESDLAGLRILVDCANGAASATAPELFGRFKAHTDFIHRQSDGVNINSRCGSTHLEDLSAMVVRGGYDVGVAFDGDADRCLLVDETGAEIDGDKVMAVCALDMKRRGLLVGNTIVATVMSNLGLHEFCRENGIDLVCTAVGDRNVLEEMLRHDYRIGGEQSGHTIFTALETTGDGEVTALQFLQVLARSGKKASALSSVCATYPQVLLNLEVPHSGGVKEKIMASDALKGAVEAEERALHGNGRVLVRASGTEALIRVMVEAKTAEMADEVAQRLVNFIKSLNF